MKRPRTEGQQRIHRWLLVLLGSLAVVGTLLAVLDQPERPDLVRILTGACLALLLAAGWLGYLAVHLTRKAAQAKQQQAEDIIACAVDGILTYDAHGHLQSLNAAAERLFGYGAAEVLGKPISQLLVEPASSGRSDPLGDGALVGTIVGLAAGAREMLGRRKDGSTFPIELTLNEVPTDSGRIGVAFVRDVAKRKQAQRQLAAYYSATHILAEATTLADALPRALQVICDTLGWQVGEFWRIDRATQGLRCVALYRDSALPRANDTADHEPNLFGSGLGLNARVCAARAPVWLPDLTLPDCNPPQSPAACAGMRSACGLPISQGEDVVGVLTFFATQVCKPDPQMERMLMTFASQTGQFLNRERAERELRGNEEELADFFENAPLGIHRVGPDGTILRVNQAELIMLGYRPEEYVGRSIADFHVDPEVIQAILKRLACGETLHNQEARLRCKDGSIKHVLIDTNVLWEDGRFVCARCFTRDVTDQKRLQEQILQSQKIEAIGRLAGGVAHDFNNLLTIITGYSELLLQTLPRDDASRELLVQIRKAGDKAASLTSQLLAFSRKQVLAPVVLDLNGRVAEVDKLVRRLIGEDIQLVTILDPALGRVKADLGQIEQVILNLVLNARDAMPQGGQLTIETRSVELDETYTGSHPYMRPGHYVMLAVSDTGCGMDEATKAHIFEPFFTTKEMGKGTGLGLATIYGIIKQSGGYIEVYSEAGHGTTFKIYLPRCTELTRSSGSYPGLAAASRGTETILLVEDEASVRSLASAVLRSSGYNVREAANGEEALGVYQEHKGEIHLLVTDVVMPRMSGRRLADQLTSLCPCLKVLYMSGYTDDAIVRHGVLENGMAFLQKPFTPTLLARRVREVLDSPAPAEDDAPDEADQELAKVD